MDPEELLTRALEPGEKVVWSDRPHLGFWPPGCLSSLPFLTWLVLLVAAFYKWLDAVYLHPIPTSLGVGPFSGCDYDALALFGGLVFVPFFLRRLRESFFRYAVTDRGRAFILEDGNVRILRLSDPNAISTRARADEEFGNIAVGGTVLLRVSYPLIAVETLRAVASTTSTGSTERSDTERQR